MIALISTVNALPISTVVSGLNASRLVTPCFDPDCRHWNDTAGNRIEAHSAGMLRAPDGRWYWYGESAKTSSLEDHGVTCYSAADILFSR